MAGKKCVQVEHEKLVKMVLEAVEKGGVFSLEDAAAVVGVSRRTLNNHLPCGSEEKDKFDEAVLRAKRKTCMSLRHKLFMSESPAAMIALYKLLGTDEERAALTQNNFKADVSIGDRKVLTPDKIKEMQAEIDKKYGFDEDVRSERDGGSVVE